MWPCWTVCKPTTNDHAFNTQNNLVIESEKLSWSLFGELETFMHHGHLLCSSPFTNHCIQNKDIWIVTLSDADRLQYVTFASVCIFCSCLLQYILTLHWTIAPLWSTGYAIFYCTFLVLYICTSITLWWCLSRINLTTEWHNEKP